MPPSTQIRVRKLAPKLTNDLVWLLVPLFATALMVYGWPLSPDGDLYYHLKHGELMLARHSFLWTDIFSYTAYGTPDESLHSWLSNILFYLIHRATGFRGLKVLNFALVALVLSLIFRYVRERTGSRGLAFFVTCLALLLHHHIQILRPLLFGEALFAFLFLVVLPDPSPLTPRRLGLCLIIALFWANLHGSSVILLPIFLIYGAAQLLQGWKKGAIPWLSVTSPLWVFLTTGLNPMGLGLYLYAWRLSALGKAIGGSEWQADSPVQLLERIPPPNQLALQVDVGTLVQLLGLVAALGMLRKLWKEGWMEGAHWLAFTAFFLALPHVSVRHAVYLFFPLITATLFFRQRLSPVPVKTDSPRRDLVWGAIGLCFLVHGQPQRSSRVVPSVLKAADFLKETGLRGNLSNISSWGSYLIYRLYPAIRISVDARNWVHRSYFLESQKLDEKYGDKGFILFWSKLPPETDLLIGPPLFVPKSQALDSTQWLVVYENNHAFVAVRKNPRNRENLMKVVSYYRRYGIPFDGKADFDLFAAARANPRWTLLQRETMPFGRWPLPQITKEWEDRDREFYHSRGIRPVSPMG